MCGDLASDEGSIDGQRFVFLSLFAEFGMEELVEDVRHPVDAIYDAGRCEAREVSAVGGSLRPTRAPASKLDVFQRVARVLVVVVTTVVAGERGDLMRACFAGERRAGLEIADMARAHVVAKGRAESVEGRA